MARVPGILKRTSKEEQLELELARQGSVARLERLLLQREGLDPGDVAPEDGAAPAEALSAPVPGDGEASAEDEETIEATEAFAAAVRAASAAADARRPVHRAPSVIVVDGGWDLPEPLADPPEHAAPAPEPLADPPEHAAPAPELLADPPEHAAPAPELLADPPEHAAPAPELLADAEPAASPTLAEPSPSGEDRSEPDTGPQSGARSGRSAVPPRPPRTMPPARQVVLPKPAPRRRRQPPVLAACPSCGFLLDPRPVASRRCANCHERIVVKRLEGGVVYLTESAAVALVAAQRRVRELTRLARPRDRWLVLATTTGASTASVHRVASATPSEEGIAAARGLYVQTANRAFAAARRDQRWADAATIRRRQASALLKDGGPDELPADEIREFQRDAVVAELKALRAAGREAVLVGGTCCDICRDDRGLVVRISEELKAPRLPHAGCPRVLCSCRWSGVRVVASRSARTSGRR